MKKSILALLLVTATPALAADALLASLAGDWIGRGVFRREATGEPERIYCKIANALSPEGNTLTQKGRCALVSNSAAIELELTALGSGRYAGEGGGLGIASRGQATLSGTGTADSLSLVATLIDTQTKKTATATTTIEVAGNGRYRLLAKTTDSKTGATFTASDIVFAPE